MRGKKNFSLRELRIKYLANTKVYRISRGHTHVLQEVYYIVVRQRAHEFYFTL